MICDTFHLTLLNLPSTINTKIPSNVNAVVMSLKVENDWLRQELESTNLKLEEKTIQLAGMEKDLVATT